MSYDLIGKRGKVVLYANNPLLHLIRPCKVSDFMPNAKLQDGTEKDLLYLTEIEGYTREEGLFPVSDFIPEDAVGFSN